MGFIEDRRSIRNFDNRLVEQEKLESILCAGLQAPSPKNRQPWRFVVITSEDEKRKMISSMKAEIFNLIEKKPDRKDIRESLETMEIIEHVPVLVLICYKCGMVECHDDGVDWEISAKDIEAVELQSIGAAVENMLLKAEELGIGSLWCADILYAYRTVAKYSDGPVVSAVCLGYRKETPKPRKKKTVSEMCVFI